MDRHISALLLEMMADLDDNGLPGPHVLKLRLFEIGGDPNIVERHNVHKLLSDAHVLAHFDASLADNSCYGREVSS